MLGGAGADERAHHGEVVRLVLHAERRDADAVEVGDVSGVDVGMALAV